MVNEELMERMRQAARNSPPPASRRGQDPNFVPDPEIQAKVDKMIAEAKRPPTKIKALIHKEKDGGYSAEVPQLPGCFTEGNTMQEVVENLKEAIAGWFEAGTTGVSTKPVEKDMKTEENRMLLKELLPHIKAIFITENFYTHNAVRVRVKKLFLVYHLQTGVDITSTLVDRVLILLKAALKEYRLGNSILYAVDKLHNNHFKFSKTVINYVSKQKHLLNK